MAHAFALRGKPGGASRIRQNLDLCGKASRRLFLSDGSVSRCFPTAPQNIDTPRRIVA